jgi:DNA-binding beta-propeller fold protein YncE
MLKQSILCLLLAPFWIQSPPQTPAANPNNNPERRARLEAQTVELKAILEKSKKLPFERANIKVDAPAASPADWGLGMVSWVTSDKNGLIYLIQRGEKADPVIVLNKQGKIVHSWGKGMYTMPHAIRIDPQGNVWTTDAASSMVYKFSPEGKKLLEIEVGGQPNPCRGNFCSTTDIAFAPNGHLFIADGYSNARILEYTADGKKITEWGTAGTGPGQFVLPHSIQVDENGIVYVADRENGRVQRFDMKGKYLGEWDKYGKTFGLKLDKDSIWLSTQPRSLPNNSPGWLIRLDRKTGNVLGYVESDGNHGMDIMTSGELLQAPGLKDPNGPNQIPQIYRQHR